MASNSLKFDVFLGKKWCAKHKATIYCERNTFKIFLHHKKLTIQALASLDSEISANALELKGKNS